MNTKDYLVALSVVFATTIGCLYYRDRRLERQVKDNVRELQMTFAETVQKLAEEERDAKEPIKYPLVKEDLPELMRRRACIQEEIDQAREQLKNTQRNDQAESLRLKQKLDELNLQYRLT